MMSRALCLALALAAGTACAAGGTMKPWSVGATPPLALRDLQGKEHTLADYKGKVVVLNFWATWCDPCREEMPAMQRLQDKLAGKLVVLAGGDTFSGGAELASLLESRAKRRFAEKFRRKSPSRGQSFFGKILKVSFSTE